MALPAALKSPGIRDTIDPKTSRRLSSNTRSASIKLPTASNPTYRAPPESPHCVGERSNGYFSWQWRRFAESGQIDYYYLPLGGQRIEESSLRNANAQPKPWMRSSGDRALVGYGANPSHRPYRSSPSLASTSRRQLGRKDIDFLNFRRLGK
jgi:hypothetical protein